MPVKKLKIYFIGIGGIGVSALAKYYLQTGNEVFGSDLASSEITDDLEKLGAKIIIGQQTSSKLKTQSSKPQLKIKKLPDLVIYSPAVPKNHPELEFTRKNNIKILSYPQALGELTKKYFTIAVSGTHGKSTTTAMLGLLLTRAGLNPTVILGTKLKEFGDSNCRVGGYPNPKFKLLTTPKETFSNPTGQAKYLVIEADEHFASFLNYWPKIIVLTNIEADHLDYYKNLKNILKTFKEYIGHLPEDGWLIANKNDENIYTMFSTIVENVVYFSLRQKETEIMRKILNVPGEHNVLNALAALMVARILKIPDSVSFKALSEYKGAWRRFEEKTIKLKTINYKLISDYGHHPTEVKATLRAAREKYPRNKIWCVFQPHQYQRTYYLFNDFIKVLKNAPIDNLIITDIYDVVGREEKKIKQKVSAEKLAKAVKRENVIYLPKKDILNYLKKNLQGGEVLIVMGAGDIYDLTKILLERKF